MRLANLDLIDEVREKTYSKMATYQHKVAHYFNTKVQEKVLKVGDLVITMSESFPS